MPKFSKLTSFILLLVIGIGLGAGCVGILVLTNRSPILFIHSSTASNSNATPQPKVTTLFFAGDVMLSRDVGTNIKNDVDLPFYKVKKYIQAADIAFANLESPFSDEPPRIISEFSFRAEPKTVDGLVDAGFDILSTANNHALDQGPAAVQYTADWLTSHNIIPLGSTTSCHGGRIITKNGIKFGFLGYSYTAYNDGGVAKSDLICDWTNTTQVTSDIQTLKPKVDFLIVSAHMGIEYHRTPEDVDVTRVHAALDEGADMFVGHHPHWIQTMEMYNGKPIFYSLGNFVFDQMWSTETREGLTFMATFEDKDLKKVTLYPVIIDDYCCPRWANSNETQSILHKINLTDPVISVKN